MNNPNTILDELKSISEAVANIPRQNVYTAPTGYFTDLAEKILAFVTGKQKSFPGKSAMPFSLPDNYFTGLAEKIVAKVKSTTSSTEVFDELESVAPLLNTINKKQPYTVPADYFDNLTIRVNEQGRVRSLFGKGSYLFKYAAAAVITGIMATGGIIYLNKGGSQNNSVASGTFKTEEIKRLSDEEIVEFLKANSSPADAIATYGVETQQDDIKTYLKEMSDEEIKQYLQEYGDIEKTPLRQG